MRFNTIRRRLLSALLTAAMVLTMAPPALAAECPNGAHTFGPTAVTVPATCHTSGVQKRVCTRCGKAELAETPVDPNNHEAVCTDNGDGLTHAARCPYDGYVNAREAHTFQNGRCAKCLAVNYSDVKISLPENLEIYANLGSTDAKLTLGAVSLTLGGADITGNYTLTYNWYYRGSSVGSGESYTLPASITSQEGEYAYVCFVMAIPKNDVNQRSVNASCTVTVQVRDLISAYAAVKCQDQEYLLSATNSHTTQSVANQIYAAVAARSSAAPSHVVFSAAPASTLGTFSAVAGASYGFSAASGALGSIRFLPGGSATGSFTVNFTAYDVRGGAYPGVLTIHVEQALSSGDIVYTAAKGGVISFDREDFAAFWKRTYSGGSLVSVSFPAMPAAREGALYCGYTSPARPGSPAAAGESYYYAPASASQQPLSMTFVPAPSFTGYAAIPFSAYGYNNQGSAIYLDGSVYLFISDGSIKSISYKAPQGGSVRLASGDFLSVFRTVTGQTGSDFTVQFLSLPASGSLHVSEGGRSVKLTSSNTGRYLFRCGGQAPLLSDVSYTPGSLKEESAAYVVYDGNGQLLYAGSVVFTSAASYTKRFPDVASGDWYYTYVMDLAEAGVIGGFDDGTYMPANEVTYSQALKLIMLAAGYDETAMKAPAGKHWASLYLAAARRDNLVSASVTEAYLDRKISRNVIAEIACKAMKLKSSSLTASPFSDVSMSDSYAPYILSLYEAKIINGTTLSNGQVKYYGVNSIKRSEIAAIIWRIYNYKK